MTKRRNRFAELDEPQKRGQASESTPKAEFLARGIPVLSPEYDNERYDFVADVGGQFLRIQAKTAYRGTNEGAVRFQTHSTRVKSDGDERETYDNLEYFAVYDPFNDEAYPIPVKEAGSDTMAIRVEPAANGNTRNVNWHEDYQLEGVALGGSASTE